VKNLNFVSLCLIVCALVFLLPNSSYAAMKMVKEPQKTIPKRQVFLKKYNGVPAEGHLIEKVPFYKQKNRNYCGPVVLCMVLNYWATEKTFTQEEIASAIFKSDIEITSNSDMVFYPHINGFLVCSFNGNIEDLKRLIRENIPVIILQQVVDKIVKKGHYRVVIGYDDSKEVMIVHDPWLGEKLAISYDTFSKIWNWGEGPNKKNWTLIILPKDKIDIFKKFEESALTHHNIATALYNRNRIQEAIKEWEKAIQIAPSETTFYYCIAYAYIKEEIYDKAIHYAQLSVELDNSNSFCYDTLGWAYYKKGMFEEALKCLEKAMQMSPDVEFIRNHHDIVEKEFNKQVY
jgi:tetratricopeptide (TPR) repeat protein